MLFGFYVNGSGGKFSSVSILVFVISHKPTEAENQTQDNSSYLLYHSITSEMISEI